MSLPRPARLLPFALRLTLVLALLALAPFAEAAHVTGGMAQTAAAPHHMAHLAAAPMPHQAPAGHDSHDLACRILCLGWVEAALPDRAPGRATGLVLVLAPAVLALRDGIVPPPGGHPPKSPGSV
jgi:hypothetical protein